MSLPQNRLPHEFMRWHDIRIDQYATAQAKANEAAKCDLKKAFGDVARKYLSLQHDKRKQIMPKEKLEQAVIDATMQVFGTPEGTSAIADEILKIHAKRMNDKSLLAILNNERDEIKRALANIMKAVEQGIFNATTKKQNG